MALLSDILNTSIPELQSARLKPVTVAVIDSGIDSSHELLRRRIAGAWEFVEDDAGDITCSPLPKSANNDDAGHGTAVAGIIAKLAPNARILDFKVLSAGFAGSGKVMLKGLEAAIESDARVINMSLACLSKYRTELEELLEKAYRKHKIVIASKRNVPKPGDLGFPAELSSCISVENKSYDTPFFVEYTNEQPIEFAAHGENVLSAKAGGGYYRLTGTSFATPTVSAITALLLGKFPELELFEIKSILKYHSQKNSYRNLKQPNPLEIAERIERDHSQSVSYVCSKCGEFARAHEAFSFVKCRRCSHTIPLMTLPRQLCQEVLGDLEFNLPAQCVYHNKLHTREVVANVHSFASRYSGISRREMRCLMTAALLHDVGYTRQYEDNEPLAADYARQLLPDYGYTAKDIELVTRLILATAMPVKPQDLLEKIICDADVGHIGLENYWEKSRLLRQEMEAFGTIRDDNEYLADEIKFLSVHRFFQPWLEKERREAREKTIAVLKISLGTER